MNPFERKFREFAENLGAKNAQGHAEHIAATSSDTFRDKPFTDEFSGVYKIAHWGQGLAQVVTYATTAGLGVFALQHIIPAAWGIYIAVPLALLFAWGIETVKRSTLAIASKHLLKYKTFGFVGIVAALVMCVSIAAALYGAKELPGVMYPIPARAVDGAAVAALNADIEKVQADIERTNASLSSGKNWTAENRTLPRLQKERAALIDKREVAQKDAGALSERDHGEALESRNEKVSKMQVYAVSAAIIAELIFLFCTAFILYYLFRAFAEMEEEAANDPQPAQVPTNGSPLFQEQPQRNGIPVSKNSKAENDGVAQKFSAPTQTVYARADAKRVTQDIPIPTPVPDGQRLCDHCGTAYVYGHARQKFCSEKCRIESWQDKNGKQIRHRINVK
jgi:hypothetical protein